MTEARPYKLFGASERAALAESVGAALDAWREAWLAPGVRVQSECAPAVELAPAAREAVDEAWTRFPAGDRAWWMQADRGAHNALGAALCGAPAAAESEIGRAAADAALRELAAVLLGVQAGALRGERQAPPAHLWQKGSAATALHLTIGGSRLCFVANAAWTQGLLRQRLPRPAPARLDSRREAVLRRPVALQVVAGRLELELGALRGLAPGNVIALGTRIDTPLAVVRSASGAPVFRARLGSAQGSRAIAVLGAR